MQDCLVIDDGETIAMIERLAFLTDVSVEEAVLQALRERMSKLSIEIDTIQNGS